MVVLSPKFTIGICAYLRQVSLSIDRANRSIVTLHDFLSSEHSIYPRLVGDALRGKLIIDEHYSATGQTKKITKQCFLKSATNWVLFNRCSISSSDLFSLIALIDRFESILEQPWHDERMAEIRVEINNSFESLQSRIISPKTRSQIVCVEHLNSAPHLSTFSIIELTGFNWLKE